MQAAGYQPIAPMNAFVLPDQVSKYYIVTSPTTFASLHDLLQRATGWTPDMQQQVGPVHLMPDSEHHESRRRVTLAVADLPSYGKAKSLRRGSLLSTAKKRKRSANISELTFSKSYKKEPPHNLIRIWVSGGETTNRRLCELCIHGLSCFSL